MQRLSPWQVGWELLGQGQRDEEVLLQRVEYPNQAKYVNTVLNEANAFLSQGRKVKINILKMFTYCSCWWICKPTMAAQIKCQKALQQWLVYGCTNCCFSCDPNHLPLTIYHLSSALQLFLILCLVIALDKFYSELLNVFIQHTHNRAQSLTETSRH